MELLCSPPVCSVPAVPPHVPTEWSWSLRPPAGLLHQTRYPDRPGSAPAACRSL